jgi:hypothetical protein
VAHKLHEPHAVWRTDHYTEHASKSEIPLYPMALYLDGVVFQKRDSTLGFWLYNLLTGTRQLFAVLKKSQLCKCGCRGWCTLYNVFSFLRWDLEHLLKGVSASSRHDGGPWRASDEKRQASAGMIMLMRGLVLFVKGDWAEFAHSLGFPTWSHKTWPCIFCFASLLQLSTIQGFNPMEFPFELFDQAKYEDACALCEILVTIITEAMKKQIVSLLVYDKRKKTGASHGRALVSDVPTLGLLSGDRLEPSQTLLDIGALEQAEVPITVTFWRTSNETKTKHRNPLFHESTGVVVDALAIDNLHTLHLGVFKHYVMLVLWFLVDSKYSMQPNVANSHTQEERFQLIVMRLRSELWEFYPLLEKRVGHAVTRLTDLTCSMMGEHSKRKLKTKAAETRWLLPFASHMLDTYMDTFSDQSTARKLQLAGQALVEHWECMDNASDVLLPTEIQVPTIVNISRPSSH